jgi:hypothetical protein
MLCNITVNGLSATQTRPDDKSVTISSVKLPSTVTEVEVAGTGVTGVLNCTVVRLGRKDTTEANETIWTSVRFIQKTFGSWSIAVDLPHPGNYLLVCHSSDDGTVNDTAYVEVINPPPSGDSPMNPLLAVIDSRFTGALISARGTVLNANNPVACNLTPIDCLLGTKIGGSTPLNATFTDSTHWSVSFTPPAGTTFAGCYLLEATAPFEGTVSVSGDVPGVGDE